MSKKEKKGLFSTLQESLSSLKLTIALLIILAVASIFGTVIPQNASREEYLQVYQFSTYKILKILGFLDMYHTGWFVFLLGLLCLNLIVCSLKRFKITFRFFSPEVRLGDRQWENPSPGQKFHCPDLPAACYARCREILAGIFSLPKGAQDSGTFHLLAEKGIFSRMGVYFIHLSVLVILAGALIGSFYGFRGKVDLMEGQAADRAFLRNGQEERFPGFSVQLDKFSVSFYPTGAPKEFKSILTIMEKDRKILTQSILVNHPLTYKGITFYQSNYDIAGLEKAILAVEDKESGEGVSIAVQMGKRTTLPDNSGFFLADRFLPDFQGRGPALQIILAEPGRPQQKFWIFRNHPQFAEQKPGRYRFTIKEMEPTYYSGLQATKDPGVRVVWAGCLIMIAGFYMTFFMSHRRIWVRLTGKEGGTRVEIAGSSHRDRAGFEKEFEKIVQVLREPERGRKYQEREGRS